MQAATGKRYETELSWGNMILLFFSLFLSLYFTPSLSFILSPCLFIQSLSIVRQQNAYQEATRIKCNHKVFGPTHVLSLAPLDEPLFVHAPGQALSARSNFISQKRSIPLDFRQRCVYLSGKITCLWHTQWYVQPQGSNWCSPKKTIRKQSIIASAKETQFYDLSRGISYPHPPTHAQL